MKLKICLIFFIFILFLGETSSIAQDKLWVSSAGSGLKADKTASSATIEDLALGTELKVISSESKWIQVVSPSGKKGWIYRGKVADAPPPKNTEDDNVLGGLLDDMPGSSIHADASDTSRSMRGLSPEAKQYADQTGNPQDCQQALDKVLVLSTSKKELEAFLKSGKIGEYSE
ncbi:MAG: SH3 domain-containing protein [Desulfobacterales bacterium]|nr:SH3 domain-containing protein [Desulfobacterales bacterium]